MMIDLSLIDLLLGGFAVYRASYLLVMEDGPFKVFLRLSKATEGNIIGEILGCFYCTSIWMSFGVSSLFINPIAHSLSWLILVLALSGIAIAIYSAVNEGAQAQEGPNADG